MANKTNSQRLDGVEEAVGSVGGRVGALEETVHALHKKLYLMLKFQEDSATKESTRVSNVSPEKTTEPDASRPVDGDSHGNFGGSASFGGRPDFRLRKLEMPIFDGSNPDGWILKAERYFSFHRFSNNGS